MTRDVPFARHARNTVLGLVLWLSACDGCRQVPVAHLVVAPTDLTIVAGGRARVTIAAKDRDGHPVVGPSVAWSSSAFARGDDDTIEGQGPGHVALEVRAGAATATVGVTVVAADGATVWIDPTAERQTINGWEATAQIGQVECDPIAYQNYRDRVLDAAVDELGLNRIRLEVRTQSEHPRDWFQELLDKKIDNKTWADNAYMSQNDNDDPNTVAPGRFHFTELDHSYENVVVPIASRLAKRGEALWINLTLVAFGHPGFEHHRAPEEYAELMVTAVEHLDTKYGRVPDAVEVILEADLAGWSKEETAAATAALTARLEQKGFGGIRIVAPSNTSLSAANTYLDEIVKTKGARVDEFAFHRYRGVWGPSLSALVARRSAYGVETAMLEYIGANGDTLHEDLTRLSVSAWQQFALAFCLDEDDGSAYFLLDTKDVENPTVTLSKTARELRHYFLKVRRGAVRHVATSSDQHVEPVAFRNADQGWVVVLRTHGAVDRLKIGGLPGGRYGGWFTSDAGVESSVPTVVTEGGPFDVSIPGAGFMTLFAD